MITKLLLEHDAIKVYQNITYLVALIDYINYIDTIVELLTLFIAIKNNTW